MITIYALRDPRNGAVRYVGQSCQIEFRLKSHHSMTNGSMDLALWLWELKQQQTRPEVLVLEEWDESQTQQATASEQAWIEHYMHEGMPLLNQQVPRPPWRRPRTRQPRPTGAPT
jgi:hypothetical protein